MNWYLTVLKKYAVFSGRARRKEYWMFFLFNIIISMILGFISGAMAVSSSSAAPQFLSNIYSLAVLIPSLAVGVRRMHDQGKSGWYILIPIYNIILFATEGDAGENEYGPDPKGQNTSSSETLDGHLA